MGALELAAESLLYWAEISPSKFIQVRGQPFIVNSCAERTLRNSFADIEVCGTLDFL